ncbi:hypothetical protein PENSPDRAFT_736436 [Peniophora sp. CONT]|nr:hypothetical protein PENSPDRAFT_736436 [Peniophora sp. CONT]
MEPSIPASNNMEETSGPLTLLSLPAEVIGGILEVCALLEPPRQRSLGFIRLGHVCGKLRQILLDLPTLWASSAFQLSNSSADEEIIRRAQNAPLVIDLLRPPYYQAMPVIFRSQPLSKSFLQRIGNNLSRAQTICFPPIVPSKYLTTLANKDYPFLRTLKIVSDRDHAHSPTHISLASAPLLRHMTMNNCVVSCDYSTLQSLNVRFQGHQDILLPPGPGVFDGRALLESVRLATNLRQLTITGFLFKGVVAPAPISLPQLVDLHIGAPYDFCASLWDAISIPPTVRLAMYVDDCIRESWLFPRLTDAEVQERVRFMGAVAHQFARPDAHRPNGIRLDCQTTRLFVTVEDKGAIMRKLRDPFSKDHGFVLDVRMAQLDRLLDMTVAAPLALLEQIPRQVSLSYPITFELFKLGRYSTAHWRQSLIHLDSVHTLVLDEFPPRDELWDTICPNPPSAPTDVVIFPQLKTIHFAVGRSPQSNDRAMFATENDSDQEDAMPELESVTGITDEMGDFLQGEDRMHARFGYESGGGGGNDGNVEVGDNAEPGVLDSHGTGSDAPASRTSPWRNFVEGLKRRAEQGLGVKRVVFSPHWRMSLGEGLMLLLKRDIQAVVPEVVEIRSSLAEGQ